MEPLATTLATVDADGLPDARTLILKSLNERGWAVAGPRASQRGSQLAARPVAALKFCWQPVMRAVRVRGVVRGASREDCYADLAARSPSSRSGIAPGDWVVWHVKPSRVEFWQGAADRNHHRIVYTSVTGEWFRGVGG